MTKNEYLKKLERELTKIPKSEAAKCIAYYNEIIEDTIESGLSEQAAVSKLDTPFSAAQKFLNERSYPVNSEISEKPAKSKTNNLYVLFLILGFPLWFPLYITFYTLVFTVFVIIWSLIITFYALLIAFSVSGVACILYSPIHIILNNNIYLGIAIIGAGLIFIALAMIMSVFAKSSSKGLSIVSMKFLKGIKFTFFKREAA